MARTRIKFCGIKTPGDARAAAQAGADAIGVTPWQQSERAVDSVRIDLLQFHGDETPADCARYGVPWIKAVRMREGLDLHACAERYGAAQGLMLDAYDAAVPGGAGETFDWSLIPRDLPLPVVLAGGLHAGNVAEAIRRVRPWAVDVSGGVEASRGVKDAGKMTAFANEVRRVEAD